MKLASRFKSSYSTTDQLCDSVPGKPREAGPCSWESVARGKSGSSSGLRASAWASPSPCTHLGTNKISLSLYLIIHLFFLPLSLFNFQESLKFKKIIRNYQTKYRLQKYFYTNTQLLFSSMFSRTFCINFLILMSYIIQGFGYFIF